MTPNIFLPYYFQKDNIPFKNNSLLSPKIFYSRRQSLSNQHEVNNNNCSEKIPNYKQEYKDKKTPTALWFECKIFIYYISVL